MAGISRSPFAAVIAAVATFLTMSLGALLVAVFVPSQAFADPWPISNATLALDLIGHDVQLNTAPLARSSSGGAAFLAFGSRGLTHANYSAGAFALSEDLDRS